MGNVTGRKKTLTKKTKPFPWGKSWDIIRKLGEGGQGITYLVSEKSTGRKGVAKVAKVTRGRRGQQSKERMQQEVLNLERIRHAGGSVPDVFYNGLEEEQPCFIMEYIKGETLDRYLTTHGGWLGLEESIKITQDISQVLEIAILQDVVHRDLKPANVLIGKGGSAIIIDFGLSYFADNESDQAVTRTGEEIGNRFLSLPEYRVIKSNRRDPRSDLASVCGVFYYCLTGIAPKELTDEKDLKPHERTIGKLDKMMPGSPFLPRLNLFFSRGFQRHIEDRFQTVKDLKRELDKITSGSPLTAEETDQFLNQIGYSLNKKDQWTITDRLREIAVKVELELSGEFGRLSKVNQKQIQVIRYCRPNMTDARYRRKRIYGQELLDPISIGQICTRVKGGKGIAYVFVKRDSRVVLLSAEMEIDNLNQNQGFLLGDYQEEFSFNDYNSDLAEMAKQRVREWMTRGQKGRTQ